MQKTNQDLKQLLHSLNLPGRRVPPLTRWAALRQSSRCGGRGLAAISARSASGNGCASAAEGLSSGATAGRAPRLVAGMRRRVGREQ
jgi:hypothetical protein